MLPIHQRLSISEKKKRRNSQNYENCENNDKKRSKAYSPMFLFIATKIYMAYFTYRTLHTSNVASRMCYSVADPDLQIRGRGGGGAVSKKIFAALRTKNKGGRGPRAPALDPPLLLCTEQREKHCDIFA